MTVLQKPALTWTAATPVHFDETARAWIVCSHANVEFVLLGSDDFSYDIWDRRADPVFAGMWTADGQRHTDLRKLVKDYLQVRRVQALSSTIEGIVEALVDEVAAAGTGTIDVVNDLALPLAGRFVSALLGLELDTERVVRWRRQQHSAIDAGRSPAIPDMWAYFEDLIAQRRREPRADLLSHLIAAQRDGYLVDGEPLSDWDLIGSAWSLVTASTDGAPLGYALINLAVHGMLDRAREEPDLVAGAVEEALRLYPTMPAIQVRAKRDVAVGGAVIPAGQLVHACLFTANLDPARFPDPQRFDPSRTPNRHLTFGFGAHVCIGAHFARLQLWLIIAAMLTKLPNLRLDTNRPVDHYYGRVFDALYEAHFRFDALGRTGLTDADGTAARA